MWIINKKVYDLTDFMNKHPGGDYILKLNKGRDCTELFYSYHMLSGKNFDKMMEPYYVRDAEPSEIKSEFNWENTPMFNDFKQRVRHMFKSTKTSPKASWKFLIFYFLSFILSIFGYYLWFTGSWFSIPIVLFIGFYLSGEILHSATHYSVVKNAKVNEWLGQLGIYHCLPLTWYHQHVIGHHSHTNIQFKDPDVDHFRGLDKLKLGWRTNTNQKYKNYFAHWIRSVVLFAPLASLVPLTQRAIHSWITGTYMGRLEFKFADWKDKMMFIMQLFILALVPTIMFYNLGFFKGFLFLMIPRIIHGIFFYLFSQVSHINHESFRFIEEKDLNPTNEWIVHQIVSTIDYDTQSRFWSFLSAGLNNQTAHHICPSVHPCHYPELNKLIKQFCKDYNIKYTVYDSFWIAVQEHFKHISQINNFPE